MDVFLCLKKKLIAFFFYVQMPANFIYNFKQFDRTTLMKVSLKTLHYCPCICICRSLLLSSLLIRNLSIVIPLSGKLSFSLSSFGCLFFRVIRAASSSIWVCFAIVSHKSSICSGPKEGGVYLTFEEEEKKRVNKNNHKKKKEKEKKPT